MKRAIITGASSGLGAAIAACLLDDDWDVTDWSLETNVNVCLQNDIDDARLAWERNEDNRGMRLDVLINCAGVNSIDYINEMHASEWDRVMDTNAKGIFLTTRALLRYLSGGTIVNIVSNASHIPMTASLAYNASKGAAAIMTKQMSRELSKTHGITVFSVSPNKLRGTKMSETIDQRVCEVRGWSKSEAEKYQLAALPAGEETDPAVLAEFIAFLLSSKERHKYLAGCDIPYGGP